MWLDAQTPEQRRFVTDFARGINEFAERHPDMIGDDAIGNIEHGRRSKVQGLKVLTFDLRLSTFDFWQCSLIRRGARAFLDGLEDRREHIRVVVADLPDPAGGHTLQHGHQTLEPQAGINMLGRQRR